MQNKQQICCINTDGTTAYIFYRTTVQSLQVKIGFAHVLRFRGGRVRSPCVPFKTNLREAKWKTKSLLRSVVFQFYSSCFVSRGRVLHTALTVHAYSIPCTFCSTAIYTSASIVTVLLIEISFLHTKSVTECLIFWFVCYVFGGVDRTTYCTYHVLWLKHFAISFSCASMFVLFSVSLLCVAVRSFNRT